MPGLSLVQEQVPSARRYGILPLARPQPSYMSEFRRRFKAWSTSLLRSPAWERTPGTLSGALSIAVLVAAFGWLLVLQAGWQAAQVGTALGGYAVLAVAVAIAAACHLKGSGFGLANQITLLRTGLVCLVGGALLGGAAASSWSLAAVIAIALSLDAVDGWFARRLGLASRFGARFDLEVDALLILILVGAGLADRPGRCHGCWRSAACAMPSSRWA